eukprot:snap_masked-scaffold142_size315517-processed-gene-2.13 protein:Tk07711 transcript:snap_masked-scaffold142_size315517-processed-gene-2.13-mRNA-1 annotation:"PREDICTED: hypothetical protein LOC100648841"
MTGRPTKNHHGLLGQTPLAPGLQPTVRTLLVPMVPDGVLYRVPATLLLTGVGTAEEMETEIAVEAVVVVKVQLETCHTSSSSHWKDMPSSTMMRGGMGGAPNRNPPGPPVKESWGQIPPSSGKAWSEEGGGGSWNEESAPNKNAMSWNNAPDGWNKPLGGGRQRQSPPGGGSWDESGPNPGFEPPGLPTWSKPGDLSNKPLSKEIIWNSKQFRILSEMGYRNNEIETALLQTQLRLEDALEMLNALSRANRHQVPPHVPDHVLGNNCADNVLDNPRTALPYAPDVSHMPDNLYGGGGNVLTRKMAPPPLSSSPTPGGGHSGVLNSVGSSGLPPLSSGNAPPGSRGGSSSQPSPHQLRVLVQQIQMAVQAGHLNPQILNQPLAPQTLILLNQLLQQIKTLQNLQQQHNMARSGSNNAALMSVTVNITKTKQHISNLQNQISAQQANYLKVHASINPASQLAHPQAQQQQMSSASTLGPQTPSNSDPNAMQDMFHSLGMHNNLDGPGNGGNANGGGGSRLAQWKQVKDPIGGSSCSAFAKAPGPSKGSSNNLGTGFLLEDNPWSRSSTDGGATGWPDSGKGGLSFDGSDFGIPEFEPGKPWKGTGLKNPDEDPNLTPGSVAPTALPLKNIGKGSSSMGGGHDGNLAMTSATWSFSSESNNGPSGKGDPWGSGSNGSAGNNLTQIGQDLWGKSANSNVPSSSAFNVTNSNWSNNGWSNSSGNSSGPPNGGEGPLCLVLKNLTPQIDSSTLKTLCMQHGALNQFEVFPNHSTAVAVYRNGRDALKAQKALNQCLLGNTAIHASTSTESDIAVLLQRLSGSIGSNSYVGGPRSGSSGFGSSVPTSHSPSHIGGPSAVPSSPSSFGGGLLSKAVTTSSSLSSDMWPSNSSGGGNGSSSLFNPTGSVWGAPDLDVSRNTTPLNSYLPGDLLGESGNQ